MTRKSFQKQTLKNSLPKHDILIFTSESLLFFLLALTGPKAVAGHSLQVQFFAREVGGAGTAALPAQRQHNPPNRQQREALEAIGRLFRCQQTA
jgi:hypothetical protein